MMDPANEIVQNNGEETLIPELPHTSLFVPCYPEHHQPSLQIPTFTLSPLVLVPANGPAEFWFNPYSVSTSLVLLPEVQPNFCPVHSHAPGNRERVLGGEAEQVSEQLNVTPVLSGQEQLDENNQSEDNETRSEFPPGSLTDEEELPARAFEEFMTIMDSLSLKDEEMEKVERERGSLLEYLEKLCSENFITNMEKTLDEEFLNSVLYGDPEPAQVLSLENQEQRLPEHPPSADTTTNAGTEETSTEESTLNTVYPDRSLIQNLEAVDFPPLIQLQQETLDLLPEQNSQPPSADSNSNPITDAASTATSHVKEMAPLQRAQLLISDPPDTKSDTKPNHDGRSSPLSMSSIEPLPTDGLTKYCNSVDAMSPLYCDGSIYKDYNQSLQLLENIFSDDSPAPASEARGNDGLVEEPAAVIPTGDVSEETSVSLSNLAGTQSPQTSQKLEEGPQPVDPPASESPSTTSVSGANKDPHAIAVDEPVPTFRADLLTVTATLPASPPAQSVQASSPAQTGEPEEQRSLESPCLEDPAPVPTNSSLMADSPAESCDPPINANLSDSVSVEPPKELQASPESEVQTRCNQSLTDQTHQEKAKLTDKSIIERTEEKTLSEKSAKKTAKLTPQSDGVIYKKQTRRYYRGRQLFQREESHFKERRQATKTANTAEQFSQIGEVEHQNLAGQVQALIVDGGEKREANNSNLGTQTGTESAPLTKMTQEDKVERLKSKEEVQTTSFVRITRSQSLNLITEESVRRTTRSVARTRGKVKHSEMNKSTMKSPPKTDIQDKQKNATTLQTLPVSIKDKVSGENPHVSPALCAETLQQNKTVTSSEGGVMGTETRSKSRTQPSPEKTAGVTAEDGRGPVLASSPMKRYRHERQASEEAKANEMISLSPTKRGKWKRRAELNSKRDKGKDEVETAFRKPSPPSTRSQRISARDGGKRNTRATTQGPSSQGKKLPTKYKDKKQPDMEKRRKTRGGKTS